MKNTTDMYKKYVAFLEKYGYLDLMPLFRQNVNVVRLCENICDEFVGKGSWQVDGRVNSLMLGGMYFIRKSDGADILFLSTGPGFYITWYGCERKRYRGGREDIETI